MADDGRVIDAAVRFLRTNPEVLQYVQSSAPAIGVSVDDILADAVARIRKASVHGFRTHANRGRASAG